MSRIEPLSREELSEFEPLFKIVEGAMGFVPRSMLTMGRRPELLRAFAGLSGTVLAGGTLPPDLRALISFVSSRASGCRYCQAHTGHTAERSGAPIEKIEAAFEFETSPLFSDGERAALRLARDASLSPGGVQDQHFEALRKHFDDDQILEMVAVIAMFGWLNRWNDTLATTLEARPLAFAEQHLSRHGWDAGSHR